MLNNKTVILGSGLTGLLIGYELQKRNIPFTILEARGRLGGRIHTDTSHTPMDLGATWVFGQHTQMQALIKELGLTVFEQVYGETAFYEPNSAAPHQLVQLPQQDASYRIVNGTSSITEALAKGINPGNIKLNTVVSELDFSENSVSIKTKGGETFQGSRVINTLPPTLFQHAIVTKPTLPVEFLHVASNTHTWMGESIKIGFSYTSPFWRAPQSCGTVLSNVGPVTEMYEHSTADSKQHALKGFFHSAYHKHTKEERKELALTQLEKYYGPQARNYLDYHETVWQKEAFTFARPIDQIPPHYNNGHQCFKQSYFENRLYFAGAETNAEFPGYMEGAVRSAYRVVNVIG
ncbi:MAG: NAD(P)/FAD-dependent oxidoreductase [Bacteroidia bacterium]|jgi:monoamine oxidase